MCDGHGSNGHIASNFIKEKLPKILKDKLLTNQGDTNGIKQMSRILEDSFMECDAKLISDCDVRLSGSTVCTVLFDGTRIHCANSGDSRAVMVKYIEQDNNTIKVVA